MRQLCALLALCLTLLVEAQVIFSHPEALTTSEQEGIRWFEASRYTYSGGLNSYYDEETNTWNLSVGNFYDRDTLGFTYFHGPSAILSAQWPAANLFHIVTQLGSGVSLISAYVVTPDSAVYVGMGQINTDTTTWSTWENPVMQTVFPFSVGDTTVNTAADGSFTQTDTIYGLAQGTLITPFATHSEVSLVGERDSEMSYDAAFYEATDCFRAVADWQLLGSTFRMTYYRSVELISGVEELSRPGQLFYPNPTAGRLSLLPETGAIASVRVFDGLGRCVATYGTCPAGCTLHLDLPDGTYVVEATDVNGSNARSRIVVAQQ